MELKGLLLRHKRFLLILQIKSYHFFTLTMAAYRDFILIFHRITLSTLRNKNPVEQRPGNPLFSIHLLSKSPNTLRGIFGGKLKMCCSPSHTPQSKPWLGPSMYMWNPAPRTGWWGGGVAWPPRKGAGAGSLPGCWGLAPLSWHSTG